MLVDKYEPFRKDVNFIKKYSRAANAASGSEVDANSNVYNKNIATMAPEVHKKSNIYTNRLWMHDRITQLFGGELADEYLRQLEEHELYRHDESGMPIGTPYTYSAQEAIVVKTPEGLLCGSFEQIYDKCEAVEELVDTSNGVYQKRPTGWLILDRDGLTQIDVLTKKKRHRDLVVVKSQFGENVIVTDNHPMIISDDVNDTIPAIECKSHKQFRVKGSVIDNIKSPSIDGRSVPGGERYHLYTVHRRGNYTYTSFPNYKFDHDLGYFIGFFVAEGWFTKETDTGTYSMMIKVKGDSDLHVCADSLYRSTGIAASILKHEDQRGMRTLRVNHPDFVQFCMEEMDLGRTASKKKCPVGILNYPRSFMQGFVCGLVDGDGTESNGRFLIRLASRTCISQLSYVLRCLGLSSSMSYYDEPCKEGALIQSSYPLFSIEFPADNQFCASRKFSGMHQKFQKYEEGVWASVTNVIPVDNKFYLRDNEYIYDITTKSHSFVLNNLWVHNCASITLYPFLTHGMKTIGGTTEPPKHLKSFVGGFINLVFAISAQLCGAVATPEFLAYLDYFIRKDFGDDYNLRMNEVVDMSNSHCTIDNIIVGYFDQVVYSLNQPAAARGSQSVFWNVAYLDKPYFDQLFDGFVFPDGSTMNWETTSFLQKRFMTWFNNERLKTLLTFPVETLSLLNDGDDFADKEWADFAAEMYAKGHSFFTYTSDSVDSLASCCFDGDTKVLAKSSGGVYLMPIKKLYEKNKNNLSVFHNGKWEHAKTIKLPARDMYRITTTNGKSVIATDNHLFPTLRGDVCSSELRDDDYILFNTTPLPAVHEKDEGFTYNQGFLLGMCINDSSYLDCLTKALDDTVNIYLSEDEYESNIEKLNEALKDLHIKDQFSISGHSQGFCTLTVQSGLLRNFIIRYVKGFNPFSKSLSSNVLFQSLEFRKGILYGMYHTRIANRNWMYVISDQLVEDVECLCSSLGINTITKSDETLSTVIKSKYPMTRVELCIPDSKDESSEDGFKICDNGMYFKIKSVERVEDSGKDDSVYCFEMENQDEPYFMLPSGMITHNCRLRNGIQDNTFSYTLGAGGVSTGSKCVMTININRLVQNATKNGVPISTAIEEQVDKVHKYLLAFNSIVLDMQKAHMIPIYDAGFVTPEKQYLTIGINGLVEGAEFLGIEISDNDKYAEYVNSIMEPIYRKNKEARTKDVMFNTEMVPAENLGVKNAKWDKEDGYFVPRDCYNSYFYVVEDSGTNIIDKFRMHGERFTGKLDGGSALHCNLEEHLTKDQYTHLMKLAIRSGCNYFTFNVPNTLCNDCGHISKHKLNKCPKCGSENLDYATRIIGYLTLVSRWSEERKKEYKKRYNSGGNIDVVQCDKES